jgi:queuine tRNA-ribosyltransferase
VKTRRIKINTEHGEINTPVFLPDATYGSINSISFQDASSVGVEEIVTTTLHLELYLGSDYIQEMGGVHKYFGWKRPILTDSGGFQVFSLIHRNKNKDNLITEEGARFRDYRTGRNYFLTPETSQQIQHKLGSDIRVVLDEPLSLEADYDSNLASVRRTTEWAKRSKQEFCKLLSIEESAFANYPNRPLLCGVIQGGGSKELRKRSAEELMNIGFDIYNYGGLSLGPDGKQDLELGEYLVDLLPKDKPRYAMGIGTPDDIFNLAAMGWDLFDCVLPTRNARHGYLFVPLGEGDVDYGHYSVLHLKSERYKHDSGPICSTSPAELRNVSRAYLRHLIRCKEPAGFRLATLQNLHFYSQCLESIRTRKL